MNSNSIYGAVISGCLIPVALCALFKHGPLALEGGACDKDNPESRFEFPRKLRGKLIWTN